MQSFIIKIIDYFEKNWIKVLIITTLCSVIIALIPVIITQSRKPVQPVKDFNIERDSLEITASDLIIPELKSNLELEYVYEKDWEPLTEKQIKENINKINNKDLYIHLLEQELEIDLENVDIKE